MKKIITVLRDFWIILGIAIAMFMIIEIGISTAFYLRSFWHKPSPNFRGNADTYDDRAWAVRYFKEIDQIEQGRTLRWNSYTYWRRTPRQGEFITINSDGLRETINPPTPEGAVKVFMFGGSTMWGLGSEDARTIPSSFSREANNRGIISKVTNYGQYAFVSTQNVIELMLQLQKGNIPDVVIFYDGVNDTFTAYQQGVPGLPHDEFQREREFGLTSRNDIQAQAALFTINRLETIRMLNGLLKKIGLRRDDYRMLPLQYARPISDKKLLAQSVVETYLNNIKLVQALSVQYGFKCLFYWQPVIYLKRNLTDYERQSFEYDIQYPGMKEFYLQTYETLKNREEKIKNDLPFHDISGIFDNSREPIFVDFNHMGGKGNDVIARRMVEDYLRLVKPDVPGSRPAGSP